MYLLSSTKHLLWGHFNHNYFYVYLISTHYFALLKYIYFFIYYPVFLRFFVKSDVFVYFFNLEIKEPQISKNLKIYIPIKKVCSFEKNYRFWWFYTNFFWKMYWKIRVNLLQKFSGYKGEILKTGGIGS